MEALDLRLLADATTDRPRPTAKIAKLDLIDLLRPVPPEPVFEARPAFVVITTPHEMHERWQLWLRIRGSLVLTLSLLTAVLVLLYLV